MPENQHPDPQPSVASLVGGIFEDGQKLVRQEVALARREVAEACAKAKTGAALLTGALAVCGVGGVLLGFMLVKLLQQFLLPHHEWACFGIVGGLFASVGAALAYCGSQKINEVHWSLPQTTETLREDAQAVGAAVSQGGSAVGILLKR
jgi:Putative Actinobacterial Holin-X, holin superfamily III